jgi:cyclic lactone autoinducer peptide
MKNLFAKYAGVIAALAIMVTAASVNRACFLVMHQPKMPEGADKLRRL